MRAPLAVEEWYHVYNRGTEKRNIFLSKKGYERFLTLLYLSNSSNPMHISNHQGSTLPQLLEIPRGEPLVDIGAYCLMPNHFHILLRQREDAGISRFMQKVSTGYTMYFNILHDRTGTLFQGKFKSEHADSDRYLKYLLAYIHLNPLTLLDPQWKEDGIKNKKKAWVYLNDYTYSSYLDYLGEKRALNKVVDSTALPLYFKTPRALQTDMLEWMSYPDEK